MRIGIVGAGKIGGNAARLFATAGHRVAVSFSRDPLGLAALADSIGGTTDTPARVVRDADVVVLSVPWAAVDQSIDTVGGPGALDGKIVLDTTNQFSRRVGLLTVIDLGKQSAAQYNAKKAPRARWVKAFNTLTAGFQADSAGRSGPNRVVMFYGTDDHTTVAAIEQLINDSGFVPVRTGTLDRNDVGHQEPKGDLYGEEFHYDEAVALVERLRGTPPSGRGRP